MMTGCYAKGCRNHSRNGVKMNFFPKNPARRAIWTNNCKKFGAITYTLPHDHSALCEFHFTADMWEKPRVDGKKKLKCTAQPTIFGNSVVQAECRPRHCPAKVGSLKTMVVQNNPNKKGIQIVTLPMYESEYKKLMPKNQVTVRKVSSMKNENNIAVSQNINKPKPSITVKKVSLLLNNNLASSCTGQTLAKVAMESIKTSNDSKLQNGKQDVEKNSNIHSGTHLQDEDSDTDSFIANNFEPISDNEMDFNENFEPVSDDDLIMNEKSSQQQKAEIKSDTSEEQLIVNPKLDPIISEENDLDSLQRVLTESFKDTPRCSRCAMVEKICMKSERIRMMMKTNCKKNSRQENKKVKALTQKIKLLEGNQQILRKILNDDQIDFLGKNQKRVAKWSQSTLDRANQYRNQFGKQGYQLLLSHNWPLPSIKSLHNRRSELTPCVAVDFKTEDTTDDSCDS